MPEEGFDVSMHRGSAKPTPDFAVPSTGAPATRESTHGMTAKIVEEAAQRMRDEEEKFGDFAYGFGKAGTLRSEV